MTQRLNSLSVVILAHEYSVLFEKVMESVSWCDEIVVLVSVEVKEIKELCERMGAKLFFRKFDGFGPQKQFAISCASHDWILNIDSDEIVTPSCKEKIERLLDSETLDSSSAFTLKRKLVFLNKIMSFSGTPSRPIRLFNRKRAFMNDSTVHEEIFTAGKVSHLNEPLYHYSYSSLEDYFTKFNRYTSLGALELYQQGKRTHTFFIWARLPFLFFRRYIVQLGFLDGHPGFIWSLLSAWYSSIKYLKLQELQQSKKAPTLYTPVTNNVR